jgi:hypothetical protein
MLGKAPEGVLVSQGTKRPAAKISNRALYFISKHSTKGNAQHCY